MPNEDEIAAYVLLEGIRWGDDGPTECPHCASERGAWFLQPRDPGGRRSKGGTAARSCRRVWKCKDCRRQFSVLTNTIMHGTKMPVRAWVGTLQRLCTSTTGVTPREVAQEWGIADASARLMLDRLRASLANPEVAGANMARNAPLFVAVGPQAPVTARVTNKRVKALPRSNRADVIDSAVASIDRAIAEALDATLQGFEQVADDAFRSVALEVEKGTKKVRPRKQSHVPERAQ